MSKVNVRDREETKAWPYEFLVHRSDEIQGIQSERNGVMSGLGLDKTVSCAWTSLMDKAQGVLGSVELQLIRLVASRQAESLMRV